MTPSGKVVHLITGLGVGGAETMLAKIVTASSNDKSTSLVISMTAGGETRQILENAGIRVLDLGMTRGRPSLMALARLIWILRDEKPSVLMTWLYHADFLGLVASLFFPKISLIWNLRCSNMGSDYYTGITGYVVRLLARFSGIPAAVVINSETGRIMHAEMGYWPRRWVNIPNGFNLDLLGPIPDDRTPLLEDIGINPARLVVGIIARYDPVKGYPVLLKAASQVLETQNNIQFVLVGKDVNADNPAMSSHLSEHLLDRFSFLGQRSDIARLNNAFDIAISASHSEGFPNTIGEAMACATPCIVTDVGDCREIVGDTGVVVPPNDDHALAQAILKLAASPDKTRQRLGQEARLRISERYSIATISRQYADLFRDIQTN